MSLDRDIYKSKNELNLKNNKEIQINKVTGIYLDKFRKFKGATLELGENITVIFGRNGTLKSTVMGLIAHPFRTEEKDVFGKVK
ncbi:hypothetical protein [Limosilactobacillus gastricus]|uniref:hypothetical protein n=1 Tax=Limosilactobacillus gastricus TaxID=227942 RepID=UPI001145E6F0|nr:hypothetical protein [Limosilactobacillus gastricus]